MVVDGVFEGYNSSYKVDMVAKMSFGCEAVGLVVSAKIRRVSKRGVQCQDDETQFAETRS